MKLIYQTQSGDNALYVFEDEGNHLLKINTLTETHSVYNPNDPLVEPLNGHYWNFITILPFIRPMKEVCLLGLGAGTITRQLALYHPQVHVDGVELDPVVIRIASDYFSLRQRNLTIHHEDGRQFIEMSHTSYDLIILDAFDGGNLSTAFLTTDFFTIAKKHLAHGGLFIANYILSYPLQRAIKELFLSTYSNVWLIPVAESTNFLIIGSDLDHDLENAKYKEMPARLKPLAEYISEKARKIKSVDS